MNKILTILGAALLALPLAAQNSEDNGWAKSPADLLEGKIAGVRVSSTDGNINGAKNVNIRGVNSLRTAAQPLWIVDGVYIGNTLADNSDAFYQYGEKSYTSLLNQFASLNPYEIESIEVISNLSATAIYGARGANGVIIINTKRAKEDGTKVEWNSNLDLTCPAIRGSNLFHPGLGHSHRVSVSGKNGSTIYRIALDYRNIKGVSDRNDSYTGGLTANFDTHANSVVWFGLNTRVALGEMNSLGGPAYLGEPSMMVSLHAPGRFQNDRPEGWLEDYDDNATDRRLITSAWLTLNITKSLALKTRMGLDYEGNNRYIWFGNGTSFGLENNGAAALLGSSMLNYNASAILEFNKYLGEKNHLTVKGGIEDVGNINKYNTSNGVDFFIHGHRAKSLNFKGNAAKIHKFNHDQNQFGLFLTADYDYDGIAGASLVARADKTPVYDDTFVFYPSAEAYFDIRKAFFPESHIVSGLKLKGGWGCAGSEKYVPYGQLGSYIPSGGYPAADEYAATFYDGLWRLRSTEANYGFSFALLDGRISGSAALYYKDTADKMKVFCFGTYKKYWDWTGRQDVYGIESRIANRGIEGTLEGIILKGEKYQWSISANGAYNVNQITEIAAGDVAGKPLGSGVACTRNVLGRSVSQFCGFVETETGFLDRNSDGVVNEYDRTIIGNGLPRLSGGFGSDFSYGRFSAHIQFSGAAGFNILNINKLVNDRTTSIFDISDKYVEKGDYLRLSRLSAAYELPLKTKVLKSVKFTATGTNLLTLTGYSGWNPDVNCFGGSPSTIGVDYGSYPAFRSFILGVSLVF